MMKKLFFSLMATCLLMTVFSCGNGSTATQQQMDSLQAAYDQRNADYENLNEYLTVIANGLDSIAVQEGQLFASSGESPSLSREQIAALEKKLKNSNAATAHLRTIIQSLNDQIAAKDAELDQLRKELSNRNVSIEYLMASMKSLQDKSDRQQQTITQQESALQAKDDQINEGFVKMGPKSELKKLGLLSGGSLLKKSKVDYDNMDKKLFQRIDIRKTKRIEIPFKKAKILTAVPSDSYSMEQRDDYNYLIITNVERFWSVSNYLIIQTD